MNAPQKNSPKKRKDSFLTTGMTLLILLPMLLMMLPTVVFMAFGMLPTFIALVIDSNTRTKIKYKWLCIGGMNFAGTLPFLFKLWFGENTFDGAISLFLEGFPLLVVYFAAAVGWLFCRCIPPIVLNITEIADQRRVVALREMQAKLIAKWGEEVAEGVDKNTVKRPVLTSAPVPPNPNPAKTPSN